MPAAASALNTSPLDVDTSNLALEAEFPIPKLPEEVMRTFSVPEVSKAIISAAGKRIAVFVSPV